MSGMDRFFVNVYSNTGCDDCNCFSCDGSCHCECDGSSDDCDWGD